MSAHPNLVARTICLLAALSEGVLAGPGIKRRFADLRLPPYSPPFGMWIAIGTVYYAIRLFVLRRLLTAAFADCFRAAALMLVLAMMLSNALWGYVFFRRRSVRGGFLFFLPYGALVVAAPARSSYRQTARRPPSQRGRRRAALPSSQLERLGKRRAMPEPATSRRDFLTSSSAMLSGAWLAAHLPAIRAAGAYARGALARGARAFQVLTPDDAADVEAIAAQILPTDDTPGAREAGAVHFIDRALGGFAAWAEQPIRDGLAQLRAKAGPFALLPFERQTAMLREVESTPFFGALRTLTVMGMFANPGYGGNRDKVGWKLLGFEDRYVWQPPFGFYDADVSGGDGGGEGGGR